MFAGCGTTRWSAVRSVGEPGVGGWAVGGWLVVGFEPAVVLVAVVAVVGGADAGLLPLPPQAVAISRGAAHTLTIVAVRKGGARPGIPRGEPKRGPFPARLA